MAVYQVYPSEKKSFFSGLSVNMNLILINVIVFVVVGILFAVNKENPQFVYDLVAIKPANILQGKYLWTFFTSMFMHAGLFHLFANMFSLLFIGGLVERILGPKRYFFFYMVSGLFASLLFILISWGMLGMGYPSDYSTFAVGASGALFGLVGLLMLLTPNLSVYIMFIPIPIKMKYAAPGMLILLWIVSIVGKIGIGNVAHLGGFIFGLAYGFILLKRFPKKTKQISEHFS